MPVQVITLRDENYPQLLREIRDAPKQLYYKGTWDKEIFENCLAVVGSRLMTTYGRQAVEQIVTEVAAAGVTIVSGFMYGVDAASHKAALRGRGRTIAVLPCGINIIHPEYQKDLYFEILNQKGLVVSEYQGNLLPVNWTYPRRNRIIAGLSKATLIIEAGEKSGSLITANFAKKFGRKVFALPGPINSENSKGTLRLIREGATMVTSAKDVLDYYRLASSSSSSSLPHKIHPVPLRSAPARPTALAELRSGVLGDSLSRLEKQIIQHLQREPLEIDVMARALGVSASKLGTVLSLMELRGLIHQEGNKYYAN